MKNTSASLVILVEGVTQPAFVEHVRARIADTLKRVVPPPTLAKAIFTDENGPKGGVDARCTIVCDLPRRRDLAIHELGATPETAFDAAYAALDTAISRDRTRRRTLVRHPKKYFLAKKLLAPGATIDAALPQESAKPKRARRRRVA